ncbi:MAG: hypothetical protein D3924_11155 [Candidatus Electrothrix sp. AR4]|nr:hypothetical protein [Candidatus Electrothrix sp. AR4]
MNQHVRPAAISFSMRRQATVSRKEGKFSGEFARLLGRALLVVCFVIFIVSQFFSWQVNQEIENIEQLLILHESIRSEEAVLRTQRDKLMSKPRMAARAAAQLDLHFPEKGQEHNLY